MQLLYRMLVLIGQLTLSFSVGCFVYMLFALLDFEGGFPAFLGMVTFHPLMAVVLVSATMMVGLLAGLPLRFNNALRRWWVRHFAVQAGLIALGLVLLIGAVVFPETRSVDPAELGIKLVPNLTLAISGWLLLIFGLLHVYPPLHWLDRLGSQFQTHFETSS
ncbi:hypothetical protein [Hymenobacter koreensis]|uniref:Uncharacterized protein n=1 Tax=Hymenobacter koreensis TaxID=1084523 RepID=A0ABP8J4U2_9BACT